MKKKKNQAMIINIYKSNGGQRRIIQFRKSLKISLRGAKLDIPLIRYVILWFLFPKLSQMTSMKFSLTNIGLLLCMDRLIIYDLRLFNLSMLEKLRWGLINNSSDLWLLVLVAMYGSHEIFYIGVETTSHLLITYEDSKYLW